MQNVLSAVFAQFFFHELWVWTKSWQRKLTAAQLYSWFHFFYLRSAHSTIKVISRWKVKTENNQSTLSKYLATVGRKGKKNLPWTGRKPPAERGSVRGSHLPQPAEGWGGKEMREKKSKESPQTGRSTNCGGEKTQSYDIQQQHINAWEVKAMRVEEKYSVHHGRYPYLHPPERDK